MSTPTATEGSGGDGPRSLAGRPTLFWAVLKKQVILLIRYPVDTGAMLLQLYLFFGVLFFGGQAAVSSISGAPAQMGETFDGIIVGWFLWTMALSAYFGLAQDVTSESQWGTLEQLYMSPYGFGTVMAAKVVSNVLTSLLWGAIILALMLLTTDRGFSVDLLTIAPISVLTILSVVGIGFVFGGLALVYKRIGNVNQLMQFALLGLIVAPITGLWYLRLLPLAQGSAMLQEAMREGTHLWEFSPTALAILAGTAVVYCLAGYYVFVLLTRRARRLGVMGHY